MQQSGKKIHSLNTIICKESVNKQTKKNNVYNFKMR